MQKQENSKLADDITATHTELTSIARILSKQTGLDWNDESECYRLKPRLFGDDYKYECLVKYVSDSQPYSNDKSLRIINSTTINNQAVNLGLGSSDLAKHYTTYSGIVTPLIKSASSDAVCRLTYIKPYRAKGLEGNVWCSYEMEQASFEYLWSKEVLRFGEDRA